MLNPQNKLHRALGTLLFRLPHNQRQWRSCLGTYLPILENAFPDNDAARLLVMKALRLIDENNIEGAQRTIESLRTTFAQNETPAHTALWHILHALHQYKSGHLRRMGGNLRAASKYGHRFHLAYALYGDYLYHERHFYDEAEEQFLKAIDCIYAYPPLTESMQKVIGNAYTGAADARTMMHRYEDAKAALRMAEQMHAESEYLLYSQTLLNAALHLPTEARRCLSHLRELNDESAAQLLPVIERILADEHPHFTQQSIGSSEVIAAFWENFLVHEDEMMQLLLDGKHTQARDLMRGPLDAADSYHDDYWGFAVDHKSNAYELLFRSSYSRTYTPFVDDILAACPDAIRQRWQITREP